MMRTSHWAADQAWQATVVTNVDILRVSKIGIEIPVSQCCEDITFPDQEEESGRGQPAPARLPRLRVSCRCASGRALFR